MEVQSDHEMAIFPEDGHENHEMETQLLSQPPKKCIFVMILGWDMFLCLENFLPLVDPAGLGHFLGKAKIPSNIFSPLDFEDFWLP